LLLVGFPFFLSLVYSVSNVTVGSREMSFVGLQNFQRVMENGTFWTALKNPYLRDHSGDGALCRFLRQAAGAAPLPCFYWMRCGGGALAEMNAATLGAKLPILHISG